MHRCLQKIIITALFLFSGIFAQYEAAGSTANKPWMFFISSIWPPRGPEYSQAFSKACYLKLKRYLDTTSYQTILLRTDQTAEKLSNRKKDLILYTDNSDFLVKGSTYDTLILWLRYRVGFNIPE